MDTKKAGSRQDPNRQPDGHGCHVHASGAGRHHHEAEQFIEHALLYSDSRSFANQAGAAPEQIALCVSRALEEVVGKLAVDGIVMGHVKAFLAFGSGPCWAFSVTRADHVEFSVLSDKAEGQNETGFQVTADILSLTVPKDFSDGDLEQFWRRIEALCLCAGRAQRPLSGQ